MCFCVKQSFVGAPSFVRIRWPENGKMAEIKRTVFFFSFFLVVPGAPVVFAHTGFDRGLRAMKGSIVCCERGDGIEGERTNNGTC